jgi:hypothetical protein
VKKSRLTYCDIFEDGPVTPSPVPLGGTIIFNAPGVLPSGKPTAYVLGYKHSIREVRVGLANPIDLLHLAG